MPILPRLASIEGPEDEFVEYTDPTPADLIPEVSEYRIGPGDRLDIVLYDLPEEGRATPYPAKTVDSRGNIDLPQIGAVSINGLTVSEAVRAVENAMKPLVANPLASIDVVQPRQQRYSVVGAVSSPGPYYIQLADYRLYEALAAAGGFSEAGDTVFVIRQTALTEAAGGRPPQTKTPTEGAQPSTGPGPGGEQLKDLIEKLSTPQGQPQPGQNPQNNPPPPPPAAPGQQPRPAGSPGVLQPTTPPKAPDGRPLIDLPDAKAAPSQQQPTAPPQPAESAETSWVFLNGEWVKIKRPGAGQPAGAEAPMPSGIPPAGTAAGTLVTQRIIRIPLHRLASGDARVNIVVRPGDIIRVPPPPVGNIFIGGQVQRPGVYQITDKLTLSNALIAAGGLSQTAVQERVDLNRFVGRDRVATIRLDARAIAERTEPDIYLRANDAINVGTNWLATPLAVIRNGFRFSYGFGLVADRNFGSDIFGVPPESRASGFGG